MSKVLNTDFLLNVLLGQLDVWLGQLDVWLGQLDVWLGQLDVSLSQLDIKRAPGSQWKITIFVVVGRFCCI